MAFCQYLHIINKYTVLCLVLPVRQAKTNFFEPNRYYFKIASAPIYYNTAVDINRILYPTLPRYRVSAPGLGSRPGAHPGQHHAQHRSVVCRWGARAGGC